MSEDPHATNKERTREKRSKLNLLKHRSDRSELKSSPLGSLLQVSIFQSDKQRKRTPRKKSKNSSSK